MAAVTASALLAMDPGLPGPVPTRTTGPAAADRSLATVRPGRTIRSWPLLVLAAPAAAEVWSGWVGIATKTGFGLVSPLPGIWPSLHLDTAITLPVGVEAYAAYALRAWLARDQAISARTRRFAKWSAICSFTLGMAGQVAYHLIAQAGMTRAPWPVTMIVSCLPVLVLGMGTALAHMLRADSAGTDTADIPTTGPSATQSSDCPPDDQSADQPGLGQKTRTTVRADPPAGASRALPQHNGSATPRTTGQPLLDARHPQREEALRVARELADVGKLVSRRALRSSGIKGSNEVLNALARVIKAELAGEGTALP